MIKSFIIHYFGWQPRSRFGGHCPRWGRFAQADCRHEMRPMTFLDPGAFVGTNPTSEPITVASGKQSAKSWCKTSLSLACETPSFLHPHLLQPNCIAKRGAPRCACSVRIRHFAATWAGPCVRVSGYFATDAPCLAT